MSKESRLCYHAVPKIMKTDVSWLNKALEETEGATSKESDSDSQEENNQKRKKRRLTTTSDADYNDAFEDTLWNTIIDCEQWKPFADYISECRINMNVRQVLEHGEQTLN